MSKIEIFQHLSREPRRECRLYEYHQAVVSPRTAPLDKQIEAKTERYQKETQHQSNLWIVCEVSSASEVKHIQQHSEAREREPDDLSNAK